MLRSVGKVLSDPRVALPISRQVETMSKFDDDFESVYHKFHIPLTGIQRGILAVGSSVMALVDPHRADMIAIAGETFGDYPLKYMMNLMEESPEGTEILRTKPRINSQTIDLKKLKSLPEGTLGRTYIHFLDSNKVTPDSRDMVQYIDDINLAYVLQRYREVHDLLHTILYMPTNMLGEVTVKWVEGFQTRLPMCIGGGLFGAVRLAPKQRKNYVEHNLPWAIKTGMTARFFLNTHFEKRWEQPMDELLRELNIKPLIISK